MIRTLCTFAAVVLLAGLLVGCDSGVDTSDAPKGGKRRPAPEQTRKAPGPGDSGVSASDTQGEQPTDE